MTDDLKAPERIWAWHHKDATLDARLWEAASPAPSYFPGKEYVDADRIATLEAALADMTQQRDAAIKNVRDVREEAVKQNMATDAQYAKTVENLKSERDAAMAGAVNVRELVWKEEPRNGWKRGVSHAAGYHLIRRDDGWHYGNHDGGIFDTLEAAKAAAQADYEARIMSALTPDPDRLLALTAAAEPVCYLPTKTVEWLDTYDGPACATRTAAHNRPIKTDGGVPVYRIPANALAALSRIEAQAEARGHKTGYKHASETVRSMRATAGVLDQRTLDLTADLLESIADATEAAAKGGCDDV